jgi:putative peptidoglycan lipid II flippase
VPQRKQGFDTGWSAFLVGAGILLSRIAGLIRERVFAHYFGNSDAADAFKAAFRIPNLLQNLFGEGVLSASFIPVYANLIARGEEREAGRVAGAIAALLALVVSLLVLLGILFTPDLIDVITPGFHGEKRALSIRLVQILFPGAGLLALSAWCLGILNSHRRFFLSYAAPIVWNLAIIVSLLLFGGRRDPAGLAQVVAWGSVAGSALQFGVQLPRALGLVKQLRIALRLTSRNVRTILRNFLPVLIGRGVAQISAYVDTLLASLLPTGAVAALSYAQTLYVLPVSLFGMSVSAAELPAMASVPSTLQGIAEHLRDRLNRGLRRIAFFVIPSAMAFVALGDVIAAALYQTGRFTRSDAVYVWGVLAGSAIGLLASTLGRLYASAYYALQNTRTPVYCGLLRVLLAAALGYLFAVELPGLLGIKACWGVAGITTAAGIASCLEFLLLRRGLNRQIGHTGLGRDYIFKLWTTAAVAAEVGWAIKLALGEAHPILEAVWVLGSYGLLYFTIMGMWRLPEARAVIKRFSWLM